MSEYRLKLTAEEIDSRLEQVAENVTEIETLKTNVNDIEGNMLTKNGDSANNITTFTSDDSTDVSAWTDVDVLASGEKHSSIFNKISTMFKNTRYLMKMLGTTDISTLSTDGTVTGGLSALNTNLQKTNTSLGTKQNKAWTKLGEVKGTTKITLPDDFNEIFVRIYLEIGGAYYISTGQFPKVILSNASDLYYLSGGQSPNDKRLARVFISEVRAIISAVIHDDVEQTSNAVMTVWYR